MLPLGFCLNSNLCFTGLIYFTPTFISSSETPKVSATEIAHTMFKILSLPRSFVLIFIFIYIFNYVEI